MPARIASCLIKAPLDYGPPTPWLHVCLFCSGKICALSGGVLALFAGGSTPRGRARGLGPLLLATNIGRPGGRGRRFRNEGFEGDDDDCDYIVYIDYDGDDVIDEDNGRRRYRCVEDDNIFSRNPNRQPRTPTSSSGATTDTCTRVGAAAAAAAGAAAFLAL